MGVAARWFHGWRVRRIYWPSPMIVLGLGNGLVLRRRLPMHRSGCQSHGGSATR